LSGDSRNHSRTAALASAVAIRLTRDIVAAADPEASWILLDVEAGPGEVLAAIGEASVIVVATPIRRGTYPGRLGVFFDTLPDRALAGVTAIPVGVARTPRHALALDVHLRPLLVELGASCPTGSLFALESRLSNPGAVCGAWFERARPALAHLSAAD
jgi:FMN reductase